MQETYISIMIQSLRKKIEVLDRIIEQDELQKEILERSDSTVEEFDHTVEEKSRLIEQLDQLDSGFDKLYARVQEELKGKKEQYASEIRQMQEYVRSITDRSMQIQAQEARNKALLTQKFARAKDQSRRTRVNAKATTQYYQNMTKTAFVDPQFMDNKK